ncbi:TnsA-like heteromeric transposase endonuclease subunit [Streptomyces sp. NPDC001890]|uniref:TnsA-like heteromeric transposase endonuclease subunit n=1 Tax=Streptomyces sp. NPDC001890 TaxID=3364620 RepID=UPI0036CFA9C1
MCVAVQRSVGPGKLPRGQRPRPGGGVRVAAGIGGCVTLARSSRVRLGVQDGRRVFHCIVWLVASAQCADGSVCLHWGKAAFPQRSVKGDGVHPRHVSVRFVGPDGVVVQRPWRVAVEELRLLDCPVVRSYPLRRERRLAPGWWWSATTGRLVGYGSAAMRDAVMMLDQDPRVVGLACRPVEFVWEQRGGVVAHAPDLAVAVVGGGMHLVDCPGRGGPSERLLGRARVVGACVREVGWEHRFAGVADPVVAANVRWLSGYRHSRCAVGISPVRLRGAFVEPVALVEGAGRLGDPLATLPAVYHGLWHGLLRTDWGRPLGEESVVNAVPVGRQKGAGR